MGGGSLPRRAAVVLLAATTALLQCSSSEGRSARTLFQGLHARERLAQPGHSLTTQETQKLFKLLVKLAEDLHSETGKLDTAVSQLRTAFLLCPDCRYDDFSGEKFREAFSIDNLEDRLYLTQDVFEAILQQRREAGSNLKLLWAGCHPYTLRYEYLLKGVDIFSMDPNPAVAVYGSSRRHEVDILQKIGAYTAPGSFDLAIVNGVLGWGIDTDEQMDSFVKAMHSALRPGGLLVVGYNRHMGQCCRFAPYFDPATFRDLPQRKAFEGQWKHTFEVFERTRA